MPSSASSLKYRTTFLIKGSDPFTVRLSEHNTATMCRTARDLKAAYVVAVDDYDVVNDHPIWGVFDMVTARKDDPYPGQWSINDPKHTFPTEDAAVMFGLVLLGRK